MHIIRQTKQSTHKGLNFRTILTALIISTAWLAGCSSDESASGDTEMMSGIQIRVLSPRADMISGGNALIEIELSEGLMAENVAVQVGGRDVSDNFEASAQGNSLIGLVNDLPEGSSTIEVHAGGQKRALNVTNYPLQGPIFSGPHQEPFVCQTEAYGLSGTPDENCAVPTQVKYFYHNSEGEFEPYDPDAPMPDDMTQATTSDGKTVDFVVRQEAGVINRAIYEITFLHQPGEPLPNPLENASSWNGKLIYTFGGGCAPAYKQSYRTGGTLGAGFAGKTFLERGYAVASSTFNVFGNNCNDVTSAETVMMVKEHFIETYGVPEFTLSSGGSGGAMQQHLIANNYPGLINGIMPRRSYPSIFDMIPPATDCALIDRATHHGNVTWTDEERGAVSGFHSWRNCVIPVEPGEQAEFYTWMNSGFSPGWVTPEAHPPEIRQDCDLSVLEGLTYDAETNPDGIDCSIYGNSVNVIGRNPATGMAYRAMDNVGVQYGLVAFNKGEISADQFVDLNERIGGFDQYGHISDERGQAPDAAIHNAYAYGRSNNVKSLGEIPIIDFRTYLEHLPDVHDSIRSFSMRERLKAANGSADNQVIIVHHRNHPGGWGVVDAQVLDWMDQWVTAIQADMAPGSEAERVVRNKPAGLSDGCYTEQGGWVAAEQGYMQSQCAEMYTPHGDPRIAAGAPVANNVLKCALKPLHKGDYEQTLTDDQFARLQQVFPSGVCDYSATSNLQAEGVADWQTWRVY